MSRFKQREPWRLQEGPGWRHHLAKSTPFYRWLGDYLGTGEGTRKEKELLWGHTLVSDLRDAAMPKPSGEESRAEECGLFLAVTAQGSTLWQVIHWASASRVTVHLVSLVSSLLLYLQLRSMFGIVKLSKCILNDWINETYFHKYNHTALKWQSSCVTTGKPPDLTGPQFHHC